MLYGRRVLPLPLALITQLEEAAPLDVAAARDEAPLPELERRLDEADADSVEAEVDRWLADLRALAEVRRGRNEALRLGLRAWWHEPAVAGQQRDLGAALVLGVRFDLLASPPDPSLGTLPREELERLLRCASLEDARADEDPPGLRLARAEALGCGLAPSLPEPEVRR